MTTAFAATKAISTGISIFYHHNLASGAYNSFWKPSAMLDAVGDALL